MSKNQYEHFLYDVILDVDRDRGILTRNDRKLLLDEERVTDQKEIDTRYRIRKRLINSIYDLWIIEEHLFDKDTEQVFENIYEDLDKNNDFFYFLMENILRFFYSGAQKTDSSFKKIIQEAIKDYKRIEQPRKLSEVDVDIKTKTKDVTVDELAEKFTSNDIELNEFMYLVMHHEEFKATLEDKGLLEEGGKIDLDINFSEITFRELLFLNKAVQDGTLSIEPMRKEPQK